MPLGWVFSCRIRKEPFGLFVGAVVVTVIVNVKVNVTVIVIDFHFASVKVAAKAVIMARFLLLLRLFLVPQLG